MSLDVNFNWA